jgi:hypothetical protein
MKIVISQPMKGKRREEILKERKYILEAAEKKGETIIDTLNTDFKEKMNGSLKCLARAIGKIGEADAVVFMKGYAEGRGSNVEILICKKIGELEYC